MEVDEARLYFEKISRGRRKPSVDEVIETSIDSDGRKMKVRIYKPKQSSATIVYFHGGGFVVGSIDTHDVVARLLSRATGFAVVSVDYRLAPEYTYPAAIHDGLATLRWLRSNGAGLHSENIVLAGDSAGGHIALDVAIRASVKLSGLILMYPMLDPSLATESMEKYSEGHFVTKQNMKDFWKSYLGNKNIEWPYADKELLTLPPTLILTAEYDILRDEAFIFSEQLTALGVTNEYHNYKDTVHGLMQMPTIVSQRSKALRDIKTFSTTVALKET